MKRCGWVTEDQEYIDYHDFEWGRPKHNDHELFEMLCLEGAQAGLSWITILKKRENYRKAFDNFDPEVIVDYDAEKIDELLHNKGIVRNQLKIKSVVKNAQAYMRIIKSGQNFGEYLWDFVGGEQIQNHRHNHKSVPSKTETSTKMSKKLKKDGFSFVGPTICYAFMQSVGMVNDHLVECFCYEEIKNGRR